MGVVYIDSSILMVLMLISGLSIMGLIIREMTIRIYAKPLMIYSKAKKNHLAIVATHAPHGQCEFAIPHENQFGMWEFKTKNGGKHIMYNPKREVGTLEQLYGVPIVHYYAGYPEALVTRGIKAVADIREILVDNPELKDYTDHRFLFWLLKDEHWDNCQENASRVDPDVFNEIVSIREYLKDYQITDGDFTFQGMADLLSPTNSTSHVINLISKVQERSAQMQSGIDTFLKVLIVSAVAGAIVIGAIAISGMIAG